MKNIITISIIFSILIISGCIQQTPNSEVGLHDTQNSTCSPEWLCTNWMPTNCPENRTQTRYCSDEISCNVEDIIENRSCIYTEPDSQTQDKYLEGWGLEKENLTFSEILIFDKTLSIIPDYMKVIDNKLYIYGIMGNGIYDGTGVTQTAESLFNYTVEMDEKYYSYFNSNKSESFVSVYNESTSAWDKLFESPEFVTATVPFENKLYISTNYNMYGPGKIYTDLGTKGFSVLNFTECTGSAGINDMIVYNGSLYALPRGCEKDLCRFDGTDWYCLEELHLWGDELFVYGDELIIRVGSFYVYSYSDEGLRTILSYKPRTNELLDIHGMVEHNDKLYFYPEFYQGDEPNIIWVYDGGITPKEIWISRYIYNIKDMETFNGRLFILAQAKHPTTGALSYRLFGSNELLSD